MHAEADTNRLIESHQGYAHAIAAEVLRKMPREIDRNELQASAELGLVEAAHAFDASRGVQFKTFAYYRIRGAVYDGLRKMGWFSKSHYQEMKFQAAANEYMLDHTAASGNSPQATAEQQWNELNTMTATVVNCYILSLDNMKQEWADTVSVPADEKLQRDQHASQMQRALRKLPEKNRQVIEAYYFQDKNLEQIGQELNLSKSWLSRLHAKSLEMLKDLMASEPEQGAARERATFERQVR
jgi:RNA polymerase sigma factor for flagellar operon FliA